MNELATLMSKATQAFNSGNYDLARDLADQAARSAPKNYQVRQFRGVAQIKAGDPEGGLATLRSLLALQPDDQTLRLNAAQAALDAGQPGLVNDLCGPFAESPSGLFLRAQAAKIIGDLDLATSLLERVVADQPNNAQAVNNLGNVLLEAGRADEAIRHLEGAAQLAPDEAQVWVNLGRAHALNEDFDKAISSFQRGRSLKPDNKEINFELGKSMLRHGRHEQALACFADAARQGLRDPQVFVLIGLCFAALEQREKAEEAYRMALHVDQLYTRAILNLGILLEQENRIPELRELINDAHSKGLSGEDLDYCEALLLRRDGNYEEALIKIRSSEPEDLDSIIRHQLIGQLADRLNYVDEAYASFAAMNEAMSYMPEASQFDGTEHRAHVIGRTAAVTQEWFDSWSTPEVVDNRISPIFLGGFLRSGTTLIDTALMGHPDAQVREEEGMLARMEGVVDTIADLRGLDSQGILAMRDAYFQELLIGGDLPTGKLLIDKYPLMTLRAAYIHRAFPDAKFVFALRHPVDVVLSCWMQNFRITKAMASFLTLENAARLYDAAMEHWIRCREVFPLNVHTVRYEDVTADFEGEMRSLTSFIGLDWQDSLLDYQITAKERGYIRTPSYAQVTERIYQRSSGRWERYRHHLEPVIPILAPWIERFGYEPVSG